MAVADVSHTRRAVGWPSTGASPEVSTTAHTTLTGTAYNPDESVDSTSRNNREAKWTARDNYSSNGTDGWTASGSIHAGRD